MEKNRIQGRNYGKPQGLGKRKRQEIDDLESTKGKTGKT
jgi:hypothetical protein